MKFKDSITKTRIVIFDESPLMRRVITDIFSNDVGIDIVGIFKSYADMEKFLNKTDSKIDCIIINLISYRDNLINVLLDINQYGSNIIFLSNIDSDKVDFIKQILNAENIKFINYLGHLDLEGISSVKEEIRKEVYKIKNKRIKRALFGTDRAIAIASSTGGPKILEYIFSKLDKRVSIPIFIVQHMPDGCTKQFVERLADICDFNFLEGKNGEIVKSDVVYVAPSGYHMRIDHGKKICLDQSELVNNVRPSADVLFCSASKVYKEGLLGIVLTGMGRDASHGVECVKHMGGRTVAQDENSCTVFGMPKSAIETGKIDKVLSIDKIIFEMMRHSGGH